MASLNKAVEDGQLKGHAAEVAERFTELPEEHEEELEHIAAENMTASELVVAIDTAPVPRMWGYPAADWESVERIRELRVQDGLSRRQAEVRALEEAGFGAEHITELTRLDESRVRELMGCV